MKYRALLPHELEAVQAFAKHEGRHWKKALSEVYWYNARVWRNPEDDKSLHGNILHGIRNSLGPSWLDTYKLPKAE